MSTSTPAEKVAAATKEMENGATFINLRGNGIGDKGAKVLAAALKTNGSLASLDLGVTKRFGAYDSDNEVDAHEEDEVDSHESGEDSEEDHEDESDEERMARVTREIYDDAEKATAREVARLEEKGKTVDDAQRDAIKEDFFQQFTVEAAKYEARRQRNERLKKEAFKMLTGINSIGDEGAKELAAALKTNRSLTYLNLEGNSIGNEGAKDLAAALKINGSLQTLDLRANNIGDRGVLSEIAAALARNKANPPQRNDAKWLQAVRDAITNGDEHAWGRAKLMVVGRGAAGKTSTVRSLLGQSPVGEHISTEVADIHRTNALDWAPLDTDHGEFNAQVRHAAARRVQPEPEPGRQSLPRRISAAARASLRRLSRASSASPAAGAASAEPEPKPPLLAPEDVAKAFAMRPEDQALFQQAGPAKARDVSFTIWDYGGQRVFYALHHIFLTDKGVYLVVFDMREIVGKEHFKDVLSRKDYDNLASQDEAVEFLRFWLNSIKLHAPGAPVLMLGTFKDQVHQLREVNRVLRERLAAGLFKRLVKPEGGHLFFAVDNSSTDPERATELRSVIAATAAEQRYVREKIPLAWLKLHEDLLQSGAPYMLYEQVVEMAAAYERSRRDADEMLRYFHGLGVVVHLRGSSVIQRVVVIDPQWLLDKLARVIADDLHAQTLLADPQLEADGLMPAYERMRRNTIASRSLLEWLWAGEDVVDYLIQFMDANMLLCPWRFDPEAAEDEFLVSGLLSDSIQEVRTSKFKRGLTCELDFSGAFLPDGVFHRLVAQCAAFASHDDVVLSGLVAKAPKVDRRTAKIFFGRTAFLLEVEADSIRVTVSASAHEPAKIIKLLVSMIDKQQESVFRGLPWDLLLHSPDSGIRVKYEDAVAARDAGSAEIWGVDEDDDDAADVDSLAPFFDERFGALTSDEDGTEVTPISVPPLARGEEAHLFLSHVQSTGGDLADNLRLKLANRGLKVWFDQAYRGKLNQEAMLDGVRRSHAYVLVLTDGIFASAAVQAELKCAIDAGKPIVPVHEADMHRKSFAPFGKFIASTPSFCKGFFVEEESLPVRRKWYEEGVFLRELVRRCFA